MGTIDIETLLKIFAGAGVISTCSVFIILGYYIGKAVTNMHKGSKK